MTKIHYLIFAFLSLFIFTAKGALTGTRTYDFRDGTIISAGSATDGSLTLSGNYSLHGSTYGLDMKVDGTIKIAVSGNSTFRFLGSAYSGLKVQATTSNGTDLGTQDAKVAQDLTDTYDFVYAGPADTITFKTVAGGGNDLYLPTIEVIPQQLGGDSTLTAAEKNVVYFYDLRDGSIIPNSTSLNGNYTIEKGLFKIECGPSNAYGYNGSQHGSILKTGNIITLKVAGNSYIKIGGCQYSNGAVTLTSTTGDFDVASQNTQTASCYDGTGPFVDFLYVGSAGEVKLNFTSGTTYIPVIEVVPVPYDVQLSQTQWVKKSGTITVNGTDINLTAGDTITDNATLSVSDGTVLAASPSVASVSINLAGKQLSDYTPTFSGDIDTVTVSNDTLHVFYADSTTIPNSYDIVVVDNSVPQTRTYDFRDGSIISAGLSPDSSLILSGNYSLHGSKYGLDMKVDGEIKIAVSGNSTFRFLGSAYSGLKVQATTSDGTDLGTQDAKVAQDLTDTYDFVYAGPADTITFKTIAGGGNDLYLPTIEVIPQQLGGDSTLTAAEKNIIYFYDLRDGSIIPNSTSLNGNYTIEKGLFKIECGPSNAYGYNGSQHGSILKTGNVITLKVAGNSYIKIGGCQYSNGAVTLTSTTGGFDVASKNTQTASCYDGTGPFVDFLYVGSAGEVKLNFTSGTTYIPVIEVVPVPYDVLLNQKQWAKKSGTITVNGITINLASGDSISDNATVTVSNGTVISATSDLASVRIDLAGKQLSDYTPTFTGDIDTVTVSNDTLHVVYTDSTTIPNSYDIVVADNSNVVQAEAGKTYTYSFCDGSVLPQTSYQSLRYPTFVTSDGILTINSNTTDASKQFGYHDSSHGGVFYSGNSFKIKVAGNATITFITCTYSAANSTLQFTDADSNVLGSIAADNNGGADGAASSFTYTGPAGEITATLSATGSVYIHGLSIENEAAIPPSSGKIDVWDFGAQQLDTATYNNELNDSIINSWYASTITVGSSGNVLPSSFSAGVLTWVGGSNDRLRSTNTNLTRYDQNIASISDYTGRIYVNSSGNTGRYLSLTLSADDEVTLITKTDAGGAINFEYVADPTAQTDVVQIGSNLDTLKFVAKSAGTYHIFDTQGKPSYFRIYRKDAKYINVTGSVNTDNAAGIPDGYGIVFTNEAGKSWTSVVSNSAYSAELPSGYTYSVSLSDANGYVISSASSLAVNDSTSGFDVTIQKVMLHTVSGQINGLGTDINKLSLNFAADSTQNSIFVPSAVVDTAAGTYSVQLEEGVKYNISAEGVDDYYLQNDTITMGTSDSTFDLQFAAKPLYKVTINATGITAGELTHLGLTFTNLNEPDYVYSFNSIDSIALRDGIYTVAYSGLDDYPLQLGLTSYLKVEGADTTKTLAFVPVTDWSFDDEVISSSTPSYKGLLFSGSVGNEIAKGHLTAKPGSMVKVPMAPGQKMIVTYYYTAAFAIADGDTVTTSTHSTSTLEQASYTYPGTDSSYVTITMGTAASTTYITDIQVVKTIPYDSVIYVGTDKEYKTINDALDAVAEMVRPNSERVTIMIDPGNYEEMLVINSPNVTLKNASLTPSIALKNKGVDIDANAVRITSYYGHGYSYYSMGSDQKWHADVLEVNKENGSLSYANKGAGTTNGSYWNATVVVNASGFTADNIIFENSFNQYISKKESEDIIVNWSSGCPGDRPTDYGNVDVQHKSLVERAAAIAITNNVDKVILDKCRVVGRQDSFYGGTGSRVVVYKGSMMGGTDYIFGAMDAVFYKSDLAMNTSDDNSDVSYLTAAQQSSGRGYLMYNCHVTSAIPQVETASQYLSKPGYFGRPWQATTSEVVFYNTVIDTTNFTGDEGQSLISPAGWLSTLGGESPKMYEYGTTEVSGENNQASRASWSTVLTEPTLSDGTAITTYNFTKGNDGWDPIPDLIANDPATGVQTPKALSDVQVYSFENKLILSNVNSKTMVAVYTVGGRNVVSNVISSNTEITLGTGLYIVKLSTSSTEKNLKVMIR